MTDTTTDPRLGIGGNRERIDKLTRDELIQDHKEFMGELDGLRGRAAKLPDPVTTEEQQAIITEFGKDTASFMRRVEEKRTDTKAPYAAVVAAIDGFFNKDLRDVAAPLKDTASRLAGAYIRRKDDERRAELARQAEEARKIEQARLDAAAAAEAAGRNTEAETQLRQAEAQSGVADRAEHRAQAPGVTLGRSYSDAGVAYGRKSEVIAIDRATVDLEALRPYLTSEVLQAAVKARRRIDKTDIRGVTITEETKGSFR